MESTEKTGDSAGAHLDRRACPRFRADEEATIRLLKQGVDLAGRIVDFSLGGCLVRTQERFRGAAMMPVEVAFRVRGLAFRFSGVIQWTDDRHQVGIRFVNVPERRKTDLMEALAEAEAEVAAKAAKEAAEKLAAEEKAAALKAAATPAAPRPATTQLPEQSPLQTRAQLPAQLPASGGAARNGKPGERREQAREKVDTSAVIHLVHVASRLPGRILDLSLGGCRIRTDERFPVGIYTRVEVEFFLEGLPFRLGGVTQAIIDRHTVGIRFLDMSARKREQVAQLIEEIREEAK